MQDNMVECNIIGIEAKNQIKWGSVSKKPQALL